MQPIRPTRATTIRRGEVRFSTPAEALQAEPGTVTSPEEVFNIVRQGLLGVETGVHLISDAPITSTGFLHNLAWSKSLLVFSPASSLFVTGLVAPSEPGKVLMLLNLGPANVTLNGGSTDSLVANRFTRTLLLLPGSCALILYQSGWVPPGGGLPQLTAGRLLRAASSSQIDFPTYPQVRADLDVVIAGVTFLSVNATLANRDRVLVNTALARTITLPASPQTGWAVEIGRKGPENVIVARNSATILDVAEDFFIDVDGGNVRFVYDGTTWRGHAIGDWK